MGLLSIIRKNKCRAVIFSLTIDKNKELRILFLGLDNAGKTTTLKHLLGEPTDGVSPTFGFSIRTFVRDGYVEVLLLTAVIRLTFVCSSVPQPLTARGCRWTTFA